MKRIPVAVAIAFTVLVSLLAAGPAPSQPAWTNFTYTDWNPGTEPALQGWDYQSRLYECRAAWDGERFAAILSYEAEEVSPADYRFAFSTDGRNWTTGTETETINIPRTWSVSHHALAGNPDGFPPTDVMWADQSGNVKFKLWYCHSGYFYDFRYAESTDGRHWEAALAPDHCPPADKAYDWDPPTAANTTRIMIKPDVLYRPNGSSALDLADPMNNRYIFYSNASTIDTSGGSGFFEMYVSSNGLDWKLYAWDGQCQAQWEAWTDRPAEVSELLTFTGGPASSTLYVDAVEEVYLNGERQGFMLWVDRYTTNPSIHSYYSTNGFDWISRETPVSVIGNVNTSDITNWNYQRNYGLDAVRLGESYFLTRAGREASVHYNTGAAIVKGRMSAEVATPASPSGGEIAVSYLLYHWGGEVCPAAAFTFSTDGTNFIAATMGTGGDGTADLTTGIGGYPHSYVWDSSADLPDGASGVYFRVEPEPPEGGSYGTSDPFDVEQAAASPTPTPTPTSSVTPSPTPTASPTATATPAPTKTPTPVATRTPVPSPTATIIRCFDVSGKVTIRDTSAPLPGAEVRAYLPDGVSTIGVTDAAGNYRVTICTHFTDGRVAAGARKREYLPMQGDRDYTDWGEVIGLDIAVAPAPLLPGAVSSDFDGDGASDPVVFRPESGLWAIRGITRVYFGNWRDDPIPADYTGDGTAEIAVFRGSEGLWAIRGLTRRYFGNICDQPAPRDYAGNGTDQLAVFRSPAGLWAVAGGGRWYFGAAYDQSAPGDYDGDSRCDPAIFRGGSGLWSIRLVSRFYHGAAGDRIVPGDYSGDGVWRAGIFRPASGVWAIRGLTRQYFGRSGDRPVPADYRGAGPDEFAIFRDSSGYWAIRGTSRFFFGRAGDLPLSR